MPLLRRLASPAVAGRSWAAIAVAVVALGVAVWLVPAAPLTGDGQTYIAMARSRLTFGGGSAWLERRVLAPLVVSALPVDVLDGFHAVTLAALLATALLTWVAARPLAASASHALAAIALLFGTWAVAPNIREYGLVDAMAWAFVAAIWAALVHRRWWLAALLGGVGALAKEMVAVAALAAAAAAWAPGWRPTRLLRALLVAAPAWLVVVALLVALPGSGTDVRAYVAKWWQDGLGPLGPLRVLYLMFASHGALWLLVPVGFVRLPEHVRRASAVLLACAAALPLVGTPERMVAVAFPAVVATALAAASTWQPWRLWLLAIGNALFVLRAGADAVPALLGWSGLVVALALAATAWPVPGLAPWAARLARQGAAAAPARRRQGAHLRKP